jgi:hypothetical protein
MLIPEYRKRSEGRQEKEGEKMGKIGGIIREKRT